MRSLALYIVGCLILTGFSVTAQTKMVPCECDNFRWVDSIGWEYHHTVKSAYNEDGRLTADTAFYKNGGVSVHSITYENDYKRVERISTYYDSIGNIRTQNKLNREYDEYGQATSNNKYKWAGDKWEIDSNANSFRYAASIYNFKFTEGGNISFKADRDKSQRSRIEEFGYINDKQLDYKVIGAYREDGTINVYDSTAYDYSLLSSRGIISSIGYRRNTEFGWTQFRKTVIRYDDFKFPDRYITGKEHEDTSNRELSNTTYRWAKIDTNYVGRYGIPFYPDCDDCFWREDSRRTTTTSYLPNGGTLFKRHFKNTFLLDSTVTEKDRYGNITKIVGYSYYPKAVDENDVENRQYVQMLDRESIRTYTRVYNNEGNEIDHIYHSISKDDYNGVFSTRERKTRKKCSKYIAIPDRGDN